MLQFIWRFIKYLLWIILIFIIGLLFIWFAKFNFQLNSYIDFLNNRDRIPVRNQTNIFQPSTVWFIFRWSWWVNQLSWDILDVLSGENLTWFDLSWDATWLDVYDPSFQEEFDSDPSTDLNKSWADTQSWFGFTNTDTWTTTSSNTGKSDLKNRVLQQEAKKKANSQ